MVRGTDSTASGAELVEAYLNEQPEPAQTTLRTTRSRLLRRLPRAEEAIAYGVPSLLLDSTPIAGYAGFTHHCSYFPMSGSVIEALGATLAGYDTRKGTIRFMVDQPLPKALLDALVTARLAELSAVTDGIRRDYFPDGTLKARGRMRKGSLHGAWEWFRRDGSLMRTGGFNEGAQVGIWRTYAADGQLVKQTDVSGRRPSR